MPIKTLNDYMHHYENQFPHIFNHDLKTFSYTQKLLKWYRKENQFSFQCLTNDKQRIYIRMDLCSPSMFRVRLSKKNKFPDFDFPMVIRHVWEKVPCQIKDNKEMLSVRTKNIQIKIHKEPWQISVLNLKGKLILEEQSHDISGLQKHLAYPLGWAKSKDKKVSVYESFILHPDEQLFGLGEKYSELNKRGKRFVSWNVDTATTVTDRAYKNIPLLLSTYGYGIFIHHPAKIIYQLGGESYISTSFEIDSDWMDYYFIYGPSFKEILYKYTELTGRAPVPPKWSFGLWMSRCGYMSRNQVEKIAHTFREKKIPCDVLHIDPWWMKDNHFCDFEWDTNRYPNPKEMLKKLKNNGFKISLWEQPYIPKGTEVYKEGIKNGYFMKDKNGNLCQFRDFLNPKAGVVDFTNPEAVKWYQSKHKKLLDMGVSVFKTDMSEAVPEDGYFYNGLTGKLMHNLYSLLYNKTVYEISAQYSRETALVWGRSGYAGTQRYPVNWSGDSNSTFDDLACNLRAGLSFGLSGVPFWSCDIGGFIGKPSPELYIRWAQFGLFTSHARCHGTTPREPWEFGKKVESIFRKYVNLRYRLLPYIYTYAHIAHRTGLPVIRPLVLEYQDDPNTYHQDLEYLFGDSFLVAPIFDESNQRSIYLPQGEWIDYWTKKIYSGNQRIVYQAPLSRLPLFVKQNSIIPMYPLMNYIGEYPENPITLDIYLTNKAQFTIINEKEEITFKGVRKEHRVIFHIDDLHHDYIFIFHFTNRPKKVIFDNEIMPEAKTDRDYKLGSIGWFVKKDQVLIKLFGLYIKNFKLELVY